MNNKDNKNVNEQEKLLDHLIEYGGRQYIKDEIKKYEDIPELEPSKEFDEKMNRMFKDAYKQEVRHENLRLGKKIAVIAIAAVGVVSAAAMNIKAVREPVLNFVFNMNSRKNKTELVSQNKNTSSVDINFSYIPSGYKYTKKQFLYESQQLIYTYEKENSPIIFIKIQLDENYKNFINQYSNKKYEELIYKNKKFYYLSGDQQTLFSYKNNSIISVISSCSKDELLKIAVNISIKK